MLADSFLLSIYEMAIALQAHKAALQSKRLNPEFNAADRALARTNQLLADLRISHNSKKKPSINLHNVCVNPGDIAFPFIIANNVRQREDGLMAAIIGEPALVPDSASGLMSRLDACDLLDLYETWGKACFDKLRGSWAIVIADPAHDLVLLASDRMGRQALYFRIKGNSVLIGSSLVSLRQYTRNSRLDAQALYHYLYFHMVPAPGVVVAGFQKLGAAGMLELNREGRKLTRYWNPAFNEKTHRSIASAHAELQAGLKTAVKRCAFSYSSGDDADNSSNKRAGKSSKNTKTGAFLSGGLDSSTVTGMLSEVQGGSCDAYAIGFEAEGYDEMPYARLTARHFGIRLHEHYVTPDEVVQALPKVAAAFDEPFGNSSALPAYFCARMAAADGIGVLLAGDGGDELFAGNERYAGQRIFEGYQHIPRLLRSYLIEPLLKSLPATLPLVTKGRSFIRQANTRLPERLQYYSFLEQNSPHEVFMPAFLNWVEQEQPLQLLDSIYQLPETASTLNRMLFMDWQITLADNDLRKVSQVCALTGITVRYPMLDDDLVEFSTSIPSAWKLPANKSKAQRLRHFYKQAFSGWLPDATINKAKQGFGLPFGLWMKSHKPLQELACDNILRLKARGIFQSRFLEQTIASHRDGHAAYFGELIWVLTCLELWLAANQPDYHVEQHL